MSQYLLSVHSVQSDDEPADDHGASMTPEDMQAFMGNVVTLEAEMEASGTFVFSGRLSDPDAATVVRSTDAGSVMTDGPFAESKEHIAGFYVINADDLDAALVWANRVTETIGAPIEVRPFVATGKVADHMGDMPGA